MLTYYDLLGVDPSADLESIRRAWRLKVRLLHPDRHHDSPNDVRAEAAKETLRVNTAWDTLRDYEKRHEYDADLRRRKELAKKRESNQTSDSVSGDGAQRGAPEWSSPFTYLNVASFLIVVIATGFVVAGAVLLAALTQ